MINIVKNIFSYLDYKYNKMIIIGSHDINLISILDIIYLINKSSINYKETLESLRKNSIFLKLLNDKK